MSRILVVLLLAGLGYVGYGWWFEGALDRNEVSAAGSGLSEVGLTATEVQIPKSEDSQASAPATPAPSLKTENREMRSAGQRMVDRLESEGSAALGDAYALLAEDGAEGRELVAETLLATADGRDAAGLVQLLGDDNRFLHSDEGRRVARRAISRAEQQEPQLSVETFTRLLELCMRGRILKTDLDARAVVDEAYAALKPKLLHTVLSPADLSKAKSYKVQSGDVLDRIARRFREAGHKVESGTIAVFNRISDPRKLRVGQVLKVPVEPIHTVVEKESFLMAVYVGDVMFRLYWVGHGKDDCTPVTKFRIGTKDKHPDWYADGRVIPYGHPDNVLGDYFVKFLHDSFTGFGVHGTSEPESIGTMASAGCIRMYDADIEDYFHLAPRGTEVEIRQTR